MQGATKARGRGEVKALEAIRKVFILFGGFLSRNVVSGPEVVEIKDSTYQGSKPSKKISGFSIRLKVPKLFL